MDPFTAVGAIGAGLLSLKGGSDANKANRREAQRNRNFQERMRNTQWQAAVADMEAAGINPALAYSQGPAASPGGSMASQSDVLSPAISSAMQFKQMQKSLKLMDEQISKTRAEASNARIAEDLARATNRILGITRGPDGDSLRVDLEGANSNLRRQIEAGILLTQNQAHSAAAQAAQTTNLSRLSGVSAEALEALLPLIPIGSKVVAQSAKGLSLFGDARDTTRNWWTALKAYGNSVNAGNRAKYRRNR